MSVNQTTILYSAELFPVKIINLGTYMAVVHVDAINLVFLYQLKQLVQKQVPWLLLSVVQYRCLFVVHPPPFTTVKIVLSPLIINHHQFQMLILLTHSRRTYSSDTINNQLYAILLTKMYQFLKLFRTSQQRRGLSSIRYCHWRSLRTLESMLKLSVVSFENPRNKYSVHPALSQCLNFFYYIRKSWAFVQTFICQDRINKNFMDLHLPTLFRMNDESSLNVFHIENGLAKYLRA